MKVVGSPKPLFENLDLTPIHPTLWKDLHREGPGRPVEYDPEWDLKALMLRQLLQIPYVKDLVKRLKRDSYLRNACGYGEKAPTEAHCTQMKRRIGFEGFRVMEAWLRREALRLRDSQPLTAVGLVQAACVDGTDLRAWSSRSLDDSRRGLGDPDARLGRGGKGFYLGYRSVFLTDVEGFPLGHVEAPANVNETLMVEPLLDRVLGEDLEMELLAGDSGFESRRVLDAVGELLLLPRALGLYLSLKQVRKNHMLMAAAFWFVAVALYLVSRGQIISLLPISSRYAAASDEALRAAYLVSADRALEAANIYGNMALMQHQVGAIITGLTMLKGIYGRRTAILVTMAGTMTFIGTFGIVLRPLSLFTLFGLMLTAVWQIVVGVKLYKLG